MADKKSGTSYRRRVPRGQGKSAGARKIFSSRPIFPRPRCLPNAADSIASLPVRRSAEISCGELKRCLIEAFSNRIDFPPPDHPPPLPAPLAALLEAVVRSNCPAIEEQKKESSFPATSGLVFISLVPVRTGNKWATYWERGGGVGEKER